VRDICRTHEKDTAKAASGTAWFPWLTGLLKAPVVPCILAEARGQSTTGKTESGGDLSNLHSSVRRENTKAFEPFDSDVIVSTASK
jgi:hypothetical protein